MEILFLIVIGLALGDSQLPDGNVHLNMVVDNKQLVMEVPDLRTCEYLDSHITKVNSFCTVTNYYRPYYVGVQ